MDLKDQKINVTFLILNYTQFRDSVKITVNWKKWFWKRDCWTLVIRTNRIICFFIFENNENWITRKWKIPAKNTLTLYNLLFCPWLRSTFAVIFFFWRDNNVNTWKIYCFSQITCEKKIKINGILFFLIKWPEDIWWHVKFCRRFLVID